MKKTDSISALLDESYVKPDSHLKRIPNWIRQDMLCIGKIFLVVKQSQSVYIKKLQFFKFKMQFNLS